MLYSDLQIGLMLEAAKRQNAQGMVKTEEDVTRYEHVIKATRPDLIVETGTFSGKSAVWFSQFADVVTIDVNPQVDEVTLMAGHESVVGLRGDSADPRIIDQVFDIVSAPGYGRVMVVLDSWHGESHVYAEMCAYSEMVTPGCYMVVEDGVVRWMPEQLAIYGGSPLDAVERWMSENAESWTTDWQVENMFAQTQFPSGWLCRK